jgi:hypothetical protein
MMVRPSNWRVNHFTDVIQSPIVLGFLVSRPYWDDKFIQIGLSHYTRPTYQLVSLKSGNGLAQLFRTGFDRLGLLTTHPLLLPLITLEDILQSIIR